MKPNKEQLRKEYAKIYGDDKKMVDYCIDKAFVQVTLSDGYILTIDKERMKTSFCYGEGIYRTMKEAQNLCHNARTNERHFMHANIDCYCNQINTIKERLECKYDFLLIKDYVYARNTNHKLAYFVSQYRDGGCHSDARDKENIIRKLTKQEVKMILAAYEEALVLQEKRVNTYLKRFGLTKVKSWTFWADR